MIKPMKARIEKQCVQPGQDEYDNCARLHAASYEADMSTGGHATSATYSQGWIGIRCSFDQGLVALSWAHAMTAGGSRVRCGFDQGLVALSWAHAMTAGGWRRSMWLRPRTRRIELGARHDRRRLVRSVWLRPMDVSYRAAKCSSSI